MTDNLENKILIEGITPNGQSFRPSDWAERMSGNLSTFKKQRIHYSPLLYPVRQQDCSCLLVDPSLEETHPELSMQIMDFARLNQLRVTLP